MKIQYYESYIEVSDKFSFKDFTNKKLLSFYEKEDFPPGLIIYRSQFYHEKPDQVTFPYGMYGVTFIDCNLNNVFLPTGNTYINCSNLRFQAVLGKDMIVDETGKVLGPLNLYKNEVTPRKISFWAKLKLWVFKLWQ